jgi:polyferredoxin
MDYPRGLIRYTTENALQHRQVHVLRPRILVYGLLLLVLLGGTVWSMTHRVPLRADLIRDRNALYRELPGGVVENVYTLKITNMDARGHSYRMEVLNNDQVEIDLGRPLELAAEEVAGISVRLRLPKSAGQGVQTLDIEVQASDDPSIRKVIRAKALMPMEFGPLP